MNFPHAFICIHMNVFIPLFVCVSDRLFVRSFVY